MTGFLSFDSPDDELRDNEYPDEPVEDENNDTFPCPNCGAEVYEDSEQCPTCGEYVTDHGSPLAGWPVWWLLLGLAGLGAAILALVGLFCR